MEILLIRHGEPLWDRDGFSVDDPPLTELGARQAETLAEAYADVRVDELWVSPLRRAQQTAEPLARRLGIEARTHPWLAEIGTPRWEGTPTEVVARVFAEGWARPLEELWHGLPGGESFHDFHARVVHGITTQFGEAGVVPLTTDPPLWRVTDTDRRIAIVAHGGTNATALAHLLGIPPVPWEWERFVSYHASVSVVRPLPISDAHAFTLFRFSDISHLPRELQTR
jgi:broad specificity phosphatase PhoE